MIELTKQITIFDIDVLREYLQKSLDSIVGDLDDANNVIKTDYVYIRCKNSHSFTLAIHNHRNCIYANCRKNYCELKPDWEHEYTLQTGVQCIISQIKYKLKYFDSDTYINGDIE